jgi:acetyltransferase-like isoleucine patch superfamily enzyme
MTRRTSDHAVAPESDRFDRWESPRIEDGKLTQWNWMVQHPQNLQLGRRTDIGAFSYINAQAGVTIEEGVQIGSHCSIYSVSTIDRTSAPVLLRRNCSIGSHCTIMPGVTIGENAIVGAHSFVNTDVPNDVIAYGCPARVVRSRT